MDEVKPQGNIINQPPQNSIEPVANEKKPLFSKHFFIALLIGVIILLLGLGGFYYYLHSHNPKTTDANNSKLQKTEILQSQSGLSELASIKNKQLIAEDTNYQIYALYSPNPNVNPGYTSVNAPVVVYDKKKNKVIHITGTFSTLVSVNNWAAFTQTTDYFGKYIVFTNGASIERSFTIISLVNNTIPAEHVCYLHENAIFWNNYYIYNSCDEVGGFGPYDGGVSTGIVAINLDSGKSQPIFKGTALQEYGISDLNGNILKYGETFVRNNADWSDPTKYKSSGGSVDLTTVLTNNAQSTDTSNWKTYTDPSGFSFKYPPDWFPQKVDPNIAQRDGTDFYTIGTTPDPGAGGDTPSNAVITLEPTSPHTISREDFTKLSPPNPYYPNAIEKILTINNYSVVYSSYDSTHGNDTYEIWLSSKLQISFDDYSGKNENTIETIISTITFTQ